MMRLVVIGGSTGAIDALGEILPRLPAAGPPVVVVLHLRPDAPSLLATIFASRCPARCVEAEDKQELAPGHVYFAPPGYHLLVDGDALALSVDEPVHHSRPSIDVLFESAARDHGRDVLGVILTGASSDGADGLAEIAQAGGRTVVQDPTGAVAPTLPTAALAAYPGHLVATPARIAELLAAFMKDVTS
jgi:two-component system chemotaxis response regulator CheB